MVHLCTRHHHGWRRLFFKATHHTSHYCWAWYPRIPSREFLFIYPPLLAFFCGAWILATLSRVRCCWHCWQQTQICQPHWWKGFPLNCVVCCFLDSVKMLHSTNVTCSFFSWKQLLSTSGLHDPDADWLLNTLLCMFYECDDYGASTSEPVVCHWSQRMRPLSRSYLSVTLSRLKLFSFSPLIWSCATAAWRCYKSFAFCAIHDIPLSCFCWLFQSGRRS